MTSTITATQKELLECVAREERVESVYLLAKLLNRPYRRVFDQVKALERAGMIRLVPGARGGRRRSGVELATQPAAGGQPELSIPRFWSAPRTGVDDTTLIAGVLAEPVFDDLLRCVRHYGTAAVRAVYERMLDAGDLAPWARQEADRMLRNIEIGLARAA